MNSNESSKKTEIRKIDNCIETPFRHRPLKLFLKILTKHIVIGIAIILICLLIGMIGYRYFEKLTWLDSYLNAAMILSGMGQINPIQSDGGKIFAATYALFCGVLFLGVIALILSPVIHRVLRKYHMDDNKEKK